MVQHRFKGPKAAAFLERLTPSDLQGLAPFRSTLSVLLNEEGGILDDLMITKLADDEFYVVTNAGRRQEDISWFKQWLSSSNGVTHEILDSHGLIALQGPSAAAALQNLTSTDLSATKFGSCVYTKIGSIEVLASRSGYTGEDGFEISVPTPEATNQVVSTLMESSEVQFAGLAARDALRLEAGLCLYGQDLDDTTSPIEAGLAWTVARNRREAGGFMGHKRISDELKNGVSRRRIGMIVQGAPARLGSGITDATTGEPIGIVTSGLPSPTLGVNIAMGYVTNGYHKAGTPVNINIRLKQRAAEITKMPFVKANYFK